MLEEQTNSPHVYSEYNYAADLMVLFESIAKPGIPFQLYKLVLNMNCWLYSPLRGNLLHYPVLASSNG